MYKYSHFISENIAPKGAKSISVQDAKGNEVYSLPLGKLSQPIASKQYSFLAVSDVHVTYSTASADFQRALTYAENSDSKFTCVCGDLTESGVDEQLSQYKTLIDTYAKTKPVYAMGGNHETPVVEMTFDRLIPYTGYPLFYSFGIDSQGNKVAEDVNKTPIAYGSNVKNVYIMVGYAGNGTYSGWSPSYFVTKEQLQWLYETLEANRNKRCFVFNHVYPYNDRVGDAERLYDGNYWNTTDNSIGQAFINLLKHYKNTILFHGHSHLRYYLQQNDERANYSSEVGYRSVHISSLTVPRDRNDSGSGYSAIYAESEGYVVDVYDDHIILNGRDFIDNDADGHIIPIATYKIDTTLQTVEANTFVDTTGTIVT